MHIQVPATETVRRPHYLLVLKLRGQRFLKFRAHPPLLEWKLLIVAGTLMVGFCLGCTRKCQPGTILDGNVCRRPGSTAEGGGGPAEVAASPVAPADSLGSTSMSPASVEASLPPTSAHAGGGPAAGHPALPGAEVDPATKEGCGNNTIDSGETCDPVASCPSSTTCTSSDPCLVARLTGDASTCTAVCEVVEITACKSGDACCPEGCTPSKDADCSQSCGDGELAASETCEPASSQYPCRDNCDDLDPCTVDIMTGTPEQCNVTCTNMPITTAVSGDGCCPIGADANSDSDCEPVCGNRVVEAGESCDGDCPSCDDRDSCTIDRQNGTAATCDVECEHSESTSPECLCGNGRKDPNETCDDSSSSRCGAECRATDACTEVRMEGSARTCDLRCTATPITAPRNNDGCCPRNANANTDGDCRPTCGNGVTEAGEDCDGSDCPSSCPSNGDLCAVDSRPVIANCRVTCSAARVDYCGRYTACDATTGCAPNFGCGGFGVCQWRDSCQTDADCPKVNGLTERCASAYCVAGCNTQRDCPPHTTCVENLNGGKYCRKSS